MRPGRLYRLACFAVLLCGNSVEGSVPQSSSKESNQQSPEVVLSVEDARERVLLDRIEQLEKRIETLEQSGSATALPAAVIQASTVSSVPGTTTSSQQISPASEATPTWSVGPIDFSGLVDAYYSYNANHPASQTNQLYNFDVKADQFSLNMVKLSMTHVPEPVGFQVDLGFGRAFDIIHASEPGDAPSFLRNIEQAYVSIKPAKWKGFEIDFGQFVSSAGAEVLETQSNWNYSRSLLYVLAIPYYHFGVRTSFPIGKHFTGGVQVLNGWNNLEDNNSGKTLGFIGALTDTKFAWSANYYVGPENPGTNTGWRNLFDTTLLLTPNSRVNAYLNFDYGQNRQNVQDLADTITSQLSKWYGVAGALKFRPNRTWAFTPRIEWFKDRDGFTTGVSQDVKEITLTGEYKMAAGLLARLEYRRDWSNQPFFEKHRNPESSKSMDTVSLGILAFFGPKP